MTAVIDMQSVAPLRKVKRVQFGVLSPEEIQSMAVCEIKSPATYEDGIPIPNGLCDARMGTIDRDTKCKTCLGTSADCPGHFGYIELARPVFHVGFLNKTLQIMRCVCFSCGKLLVPASSPAVQEIIKNTKNDKKRRLKSIKRLCERVKQCGMSRDAAEDEALEPGAIPEVKHGGCSLFQPKLRRNPAEGHTLEIIAEFDRVNDESQERKMEVPAAQVHELFKNISDEDCRALGMDPEFSRPDWLIITRLPVPPLAVRPAVEMGTGGQKSQ